MIIKNRMAYRQAEQHGQEDHLTPNRLFSPKD